MQQLIKLTTYKEANKMSKKALLNFLKWNDRNGDYEGFIPKKM